MVCMLNTLEQVTPMNSMVEWGVWGETKLRHKHCAAAAALSSKLQLSHFPLKNYEIWFYFRCIL